METLKIKKEFFADNISNTSLYFIIVVCAVVLFTPFGGMSESLSKAIGFGSIMGVVYSILEIIKHNNLKKKAMLKFADGKFSYFKGTGKEAEIPISEIKSVKRNKRVITISQANGRKLQIIGQKFSGNKIDIIENWLKENKIGVESE